MPDAISLAGKTVLITGASSGIGWATALAFAAKGANVVVTARREERLRELCDLISSARRQGRVYRGRRSDEATAQQLRGAGGEAVRPAGHPDQQRGGGNYKNLVDTSVEEYDALMDSNMKSSFLFARYAAPGMIAQKSGEILFISSVAGLQGYAGEAVYSASKFAQIGFAQALDAELRKYNIKVGAICPGGVKTEFAVGHGRTEEGVQNSTHDGAARDRRRDRLRLLAAAQCAHPADDRAAHGRRSEINIQNVNQNWSDCHESIFLTLDVTPADCLHAHLSSAGTDCCAFRGTSPKVLFFHEASPSAHDLPWRHHSR